MARGGTIVLSGASDPPEVQRPGEDTETHAMALRYMADAKATLRSVADEFGRPVSSVAPIASRHRWRARRAAYQARLAFEVAEQTVLTAKAKEEARREILDTCLLLWRDVVRYADIQARERMAGDEPAEGLRDILEIQDVARKTADAIVDMPADSDGSGVLDEARQILDRLRSRGNQKS